MAELIVTAKVIEWPDGRLEARISFHRTRYSVSLAPAIYPTIGVELVGVEVVTDLRPAKPPMSWQPFRDAVVSDPP